MARIDRRTFVRSSAAGVAGLTLGGFAPRLAFGADQEPHFFLGLLVGAGLDASYMFDARPLAFTAAGKIQNYAGVEPTVWTGANGVSTLASPSVAALAPWKSFFSVLPGVHMSADFDGHDQNANLFLSGNPLASGDPAFLASLTPQSGTTPIGFVDIGPDAASNVAAFATGGGVIVTPTGGKAILDTFRSMQTDQTAPDPIGALVEARLRANAGSGGQFGQGVQAMLAGHLGAASLRARLAALTVELGATPLVDAARVAATFFRGGICRSALINLSDIGFDTHAASSAKQLPLAVAGLAQQIAGVLETLRDTPLDATSGKSLLDVTTVMFSSEFSRTLRQLGQPIDGTGTDHNPLGNGVLLGGKGIRGGLVVGASDLGGLDAAGNFTRVSGAHRQVDGGLLKAIGRPFDFARLAASDALPDAYDPSHYLGVGSVVNTLYALFGASADVYRKLPDATIAPVLRGLLT